MLSEHTIKLGKTVESAMFRYFGNRYLGINEQCLCVSDPGHLYIVGHRKAGNMLKSVGKIAGADAEMCCQKLQRQILWIMGMDIAGYGIKFAFQVRHFGFVGIKIAPLI